MPAALGLEMQLKLQGLVPPSIHKTDGMRDSHNRSIFASSPMLMSGVTPATHDWLLCVDSRKFHM